MAGAQLNLSRRALLGAAFTPLVLPRHPGLDPGSTFLSAGEGRGRWTPDQARGDAGGEGRTLANWNRALARCRRAEAALEAVEGSGDDRLYDRLLGRLLEALARLLRTPAPHLPALAEKLDLLVRHQVWELRFAQPSLAAIRRDAARLAMRA